MYKRFIIIFYLLINVTNLYSQNASTTQKPKISKELSNIENILGNWYTSKDPMITIKFYRNQRFEFNDFNSKIGDYELLTGDFKLLNGSLVLMYDDRHKQNFIFSKDENTRKFYIKKNDYYFVKGENK